MLAVTRVWLRMKLVGYWYSHYCYYFCLNCDYVMPDEATADFMIDVATVPRFRDLKPDAREKEGTQVSG